MIALPNMEGHEDTDYMETVRRGARGPLDVIYRTCDKLGIPHGNIDYPGARKKLLRDLQLGERALEERLRKLEDQYSHPVEVPEQPERIVERREAAVAVPGTRRDVPVSSRELEKTVERQIGPNLPKSVAGGAAVGAGILSAGMAGVSAINAHAVNNLPVAMLGIPVSVPYALPAAVTAAAGKVLPAAAVSYLPSAALIAAPLAGGLVGRWIGKKFFNRAGTGAAVGAGLSAAGTALALGAGISTVAVPVAAGAAIGAGYYGLKRFFRGR